MTIEVTDDLFERALDQLERQPADPRLVWKRTARPEQLLPEGPWRIWYVQGGRGGGKTRSGAQGLADWIQGDTDGEGEYGIIAPTYADAWTKCVEGESGLLRALGTSMKEIKAGTSRTVKNAWRTYGQVILHSGIVVYIDSASEGGLRIQGRNLKGAWCDEIGLWLNWDTAWNESLKYAVRMGISRIIATATPKASRPARKLIRSLIKNEKQHGGVVVTKLRTIDNRANLSQEFLDAVVGAAQGTRLERQELEGELLDDVANALWVRSQMDKIRCGGVGKPGGPAYLRVIKIGVDPSDGTENSDEQAYTVAGQGPAEDRHFYVAESWGGQEAPAAFTRRVLKRAEFWAEGGADVEIILEKNHGGEWLVGTFRQVMKDENIRRVKLKVIHASQAKRTRAEPVSAMYERQGGEIIRHCHEIYFRPCDCEDMEHPDGHKVPDEHMPELEDQMCTFTGAAGERSPDRLDSLVWALSPFLNASLEPPGPGGRVDWAASKELAEIGASPEQSISRRLRQAHGGHLESRPEWDLDDFGPQDDDGTAGRARANVVSWH